MSVVAVSGRKETTFVIEQVRLASTHADRRHVDDVLVRTRPVVYPEIQQVLRPGLFSETVPATADLDIFAWRELAWRNAELRRPRQPHRRVRWSRMRSSSTPRTRRVESSAGTGSAGKPYRPNSAGRRLEVRSYRSTSEPTPRLAKCNYPCAPADQVPKRPLTLDAVSMTPQ